MQPPQSPESPNPPSKDCFCGCPATPCRDHKYCSESCARQDTIRMLMNEPSHYRNVSRTEFLEKLVQSDSRCRVAERIVAEANVACGIEYEQRDESKPLPPLPSPSQSPMPRALVDVESATNSPQREATLLQRPLLRRLHSSILARRVERGVV